MYMYYVHIYYIYYIYTWLSIAVVVRILSYKLILAIGAQFVRQGVPESSSILTRPTRWCPSSLAKLVYNFSFTMVDKLDMYITYIYIYTYILMFSLYLMDPITCVYLCIRTYMYISISHSPRVLDLPTLSMSKVRGALNETSINDLETASALEIFWDWIYIYIYIYYIKYMYIYIYIHTERWSI